MTMLVRISAGLARSWVAVYTRGLPAPVRRERRDEITSDLWEQQRAAEEKGAGRASIAVYVLLRIVLGIPSDIAWRIETGAIVSSGKERGMRVQSWMSWQSYGGSGRGEKIFLACTGMLLIYQAAIVFISGSFGAGLWRGGADDPGNGWYYTLPISLMGVVLIWAGLRQRIRAPFRAGVYIALGVLPSILMFWMMLPPLVALGVAIYAVLHGRSEQRRLDAKA